MTQCGRAFFATVAVLTSIDCRFGRWSRDDAAYNGRNTHTDVTSIPSHDKERTSASRKRDMMEGPPSSGETVRAVQEVAPSATAASTPANDVTAASSNADRAGYIMGRMHHFGTRIHRRPSNDTVRMHCVACVAFCATDAALLLK